MNSKLNTILTVLAADGAIEVTNLIPFDPTFYSELFKLLLQIIIAIIGILKLLKKDDKK
jgi:hypothetical protein